MRLTLAVVLVAVMTTAELESFLGLALLSDSVEAQSPLRLIATIAMPGVAGRIDHLAFDPARQRLFVAALGNDTVEVVDTSKNVHLKSLPGFHEPQGIAVVPDLTAVAVANGDSGTLQLFDAASLATRWTIDIGGEAGHVPDDAGSQRGALAV